jgi:hypothetical protein
MTGNTSDASAAGDQAAQDAGPVTIPYGADNAQTAKELLELAGDQAHLVRTSSDGFVVSADLAGRWPGRSGRGRAPVGDGEYDPAGHSVAEITEYLDGADAAERARVLDAERSGKNRKTIAEWHPAAGADDTEGA